MDSSEVAMDEVLPWISHDFSDTPNVPQGRCLESIQSHLEGDVEREGRVLVVASSAMITIIGIDAATQPKKLGLARGRLDGDTLAIDEAVRGSDVSSPLDTLCTWIPGPTLFAIDAPLGWPTPIRESLIGHRAGETIHAESNDLFRRTTDRFGHATLGSFPLT